MKLSIEILRLDIDFSPEQPDIVDLDFLFAVTDQKCSRLEGGTVLSHLCWQEVVVISILQLSLLF